MPAPLASTVFPLAAAVDPVPVREWGRSLEAFNQVGVGGGTVNAIVGNFTTSGQALLYYPRVLRCSSPGPNTTTAVTFSDGILAALPIVKNGGAALSIGDTGPVNYVLSLLLNTAGTGFILLNPYSVDASAFNFQLPETGAVTRTVSQRLSRQMYVSDFADTYPGLTTDSTAGVAAAVLAAQNYGVDLIVDGLYSIDQLTLGGGPKKGLRLKGDRWDTRGNAYPTSGFTMNPSRTGFAPLVLVNNGGNAANGDILQYTSFEKLSFYGNQLANPAVTGGGVIWVSDDATGAVYPYGIWMRDCCVFSGKHGGIYMGLKRQSVLESVQVGYCGTTSSHIAIDVNHSDFVARDSWSEGNTGPGWYIRSGAQSNLQNCFSFSNYSGVVIAAALADMTWDGGSIDHNGTWGLILNENTTEYRGGAKFQNLRFQENGSLADNLYGDVYIADDVKRHRFTNCDFEGKVEVPAVRQTSPIIFYSAAAIPARLRMSMCNFALTKYSSAARSNNAASLVTDATSVDV
jgi:hypothetical protein